MATIYIGFIGYLDFMDKMLGLEYINIELTTDLNSITQKIESLKSTGGGDIAEDIAGAFEMALAKDWQGISRFAILAADAPCHGLVMVLNFMEELMIKSMIIIQKEILKIEILRNL